MRPGQDVVQVSGEKNCGKTELLLNTIADTILPDQWKSVKLPGRNLSAIFISTNYKFDILRLVCIMENKLKEALQKQNVKLKMCLPSIIEQKSLVTSSLKQCYVFKTSSEDELLSTVDWIPIFLQRILNVSVVAIDNVAAYYWMERTKHGPAKYKARQKCLVSSLRKLVQTHHVMLIYTVPSLMNYNKVLLRSIVWCSIFDVKVFDQWLDIPANLFKCIFHDQMKINDCY